MINWLEIHAKTHLFYIILMACAYFGTHMWLQEHDARVQAEAVVKQQEITVNGLQQQIVTNDKQAAAKVQTIVKIVHEAATPSQVVAAVPELSNLPFNARVAPDNPVQVSVDALPFVSMLGQAKEDAVNLAACKSDLTAETQMVAAKQIEIVALNKKPKFLTRLKRVAEAVGIGVGIGFVLAAHK